jgi:hypothetical protein
MPENQERSVNLAQLGAAVKALQRLVDEAWEEEKPSISFDEVRRLAARILALVGG